MPGFPFVSPNDLQKRYAAVRKWVLTKKQSSYLYLGIGLGSLVSRLATGKLCEYVNPIYLNQVGSVFSGISTVVYCPGIAPILP
ncbi:hypothetical protein QZH41_012121 [Actinostola sp. cb2023]|nr:hypothetical protein QZH41_012121 [Actinostola sp. cb2023]